MDSSLFIPFIQSTKQLFDTMLQMKVQVREPESRGGTAEHSDYSGIVGLFGDVDGRVVLRFPQQTAARAVEVFSGVDLSENVEDMCDAIAEMSQMIAGNAKCHLDGFDVEISSTTVVTGSAHCITPGRELLSVTVPCWCDCGEFSLEVGFRYIQGQPASQWEPAADVTEGLTV